MKINRRSLPIAAALAALLALPSTAQAADIGTVDLSGGGSAFFGDVLGGGDFSDILHVKLPDSLVNGSVVNIALSGDNKLGDIDFGSVALDGHLFQHTTVESTSNGWTDTFSLTPAVAFGAGVYDLRINGTAFGNSSYAGTLNAVAAVPETATWAMMILGIAAIGMSARRRRSASGGMLPAAT